MNIGEGKYPDICLEELKGIRTDAPGSDSNSIPPE
jgi:hypothetical protein